MPLREFFCEACRKKFETLRGPRDTDAVICKRCGGTQVTPVFSRFAIAGQGDLRESTQHGCHSCQVGTPHSHGGGGDDSAE